MLISVLAAGTSFAAIAAAPVATGKPVALEGELDVLVQDYADGHSVTRHFLKTAHGRVELKLNRKAPNLHSGTRVRVRGQVQGAVLALDGADAGSIETLAMTLPNTLGAQKVAVILVNFQDNAVQPVTPATANTLVLTTTSNHYKESSFGQTWFSGQTFGWYTIPVSKTNCDYYLIAAEADKAATARGVNLSAFNRKVYMFPTVSSCGWAGMGNVGGSNTKAWINGQFNLKTVGHELGHNYGLRHAHGLNCDVSALGNTCTSLPYGDAADLMGNQRTGHFSPFAKEQLGWLNDGVSPPIHTAGSSGRYSIQPYSSSSVGPKAIKVPRGVDSLGRKTWYYLEYRQLIGADTVLNTGNLTKGLIVRTATEGDGDSSYQIDMSPGSSTYSNVELTDGALALGQTYSDAVAKVSFTLASADANGATLDVVVNGSTAPAPTCTRAAPAFNMAGSTTAVAAGTSIKYTLSVSNRDSSACPATTFNLARSIPSGWTGTLAASTLTLSPGATGSTTLTVTSPATASAGSYGIGVGTSSSVGSTHTANRSTTYSVASTPGGGTLTGTVGTDKSSYLRGQTVYMSALVKNNGVAVNGASVKFNITTPNGGVTVLTAVSGSDGYARSTYKISKGKNAAGSYALRADATSGGKTASANASFSAM